MTSLDMQFTLNYGVTFPKGHAPTCLCLDCAIANTMLAIRRACDPQQKPAQRSNNEATAVRLATVLWHWGKAAQTTHEVLHPATARWIDDPYIGRASVKPFTPGAWTGD